MPVFFKKEKHVLIQIESDEDWQSFYNSCEGYTTLRDDRGPYLTLVRYRTQLADLTFEYPCGKICFMQVSSERNLKNARKTQRFHES